MWVDLTTTNLVNQAEETLDAGNIKHLRWRSQGWDSTGAGSWQEPTKSWSSQKILCHWMRSSHGRGNHLRPQMKRESWAMRAPGPVPAWTWGLKGSIFQQCGSWGPISEWRNHPLSPKGASRATVNPSSDTATVLGWIFRQRNHTEYWAGQTKTLPLLYGSWPELSERKHREEQTSRRNECLRTRKASLPCAERTDLSAWDSLLSFKSQGETGMMGGTDKLRERLTHKPQIQTH